MLSPVEWVKMAWRMLKMPSFDPMKMVVDSKSVLGFNLSFFAEEKELVSFRLLVVGVFMFTLLSWKV